MKRPHRSNRSREAGFSLVEIGVALAVLLVGLLGLHAMSVVVLTGASISERMTTASSLAQERLEVIKADGYDIADQQLYPAEDFGTMAGHNNYRRQVTISADTPETGMKSVVVTVFWRGDPSGTTKSVQVSTILTDIGKRYDTP